MKKLLILITVLLLSYAVFSQTCAHEGIGFYTQEQINNFSQDYPNCTEIQGDVIISGNDILYLEGLSGVTKIDGYLDITNTGNMFSIYGLHNLRSIGGRFDFYSNAGMINMFGLRSLKSVGGDLEIFDNPSLQNLSGLDSLTSVGNNLWIGSNPVLDTLSGLKTLTSVGGLIQIDNNIVLQNLEELKQLKTIGDEIYIFSNPLLKGLAGVDSINAGKIGGLYIYNNNSLSSCDVYSICRYLEIPYRTVVIHNNAGGCNSYAEVKAGCDTLGVQYPIAGSLISIYPNPASGTIIVETSEQSPRIGLSILDVSGKELKSQAITIPFSRVDVSTLPRGVYFLKLLSRTRVETRKLLIE